MPRATKPVGSDDPRDLVEQAWRQIYATDAGRHPNRLAPGAPRFTDYAWKRFDPATVLEILMSEEATYAALRPILFSGLCTWVVCPTKPALRQHGMLLIGIEHLRRAELEGRRIFAGRELPGHELLGDILGRVRVLGQDFFSDFYYPIGGLAQVLRSTTPDNFRRSVQRRSAETMSVVALMQIYHHHALHLSHSGKHYKASLNKGAFLVETIFKKGRKEEGSVVKDNVKDRWQRLAETAALAYAAASIEVEAGVSLLTAIRTGTASYERDGVRLAEWISRARYAVEAILSPLHEPRFAALNSAALPPGAAEAIPAPAFIDAEQMLIRNYFRK